MGYSLKEAKDLVIKAGKILVESGLIARTWGNISARISDTQFVITPSGLAYETLTPEQIVVVNIKDCSHEGNIKPSSEKGIHADAYRLRSEVNFIIHTHQVKASVLSIEGKNLLVERQEHKKILGEVVPCAGYGISSTKTLRKKVALEVSRYPDSPAILMKHHGTMCMGTDLEHSFLIATTLEELAQEKYIKVCKQSKVEKKALLDYGRSERKGDTFQLKWDKWTTQYQIYELPESAPSAARLHASIYKASNVNFILHATDEEIVTASSKQMILRPYLDDLAQIAGINLKTIENALTKPQRVAKELKQKNAVLLSNSGALCTGKTADDAKAVEMVLKKGCIASIYCNEMNNTKWLSTIDAWIQRVVYVKKYSKKKV